MEQFDHDLKGIVGNTMNQYSSSSSFNDVWSKHQKTMSRGIGRKKIFSIPLVAIITILAVFTVGFAGYQLTRVRTDNTDYPFVNDSRVLGKWQTVDLVKFIDEFSPGKRNLKGTLFLTQLDFSTGGELQYFTRTSNGALEDALITWTKGLVINKTGQTASKYEIREINGDTYMFFEWKNGDYVFRGDNPNYYVLKKGDTPIPDEYKPFEDKIDYPFVDDPQVTGHWEAVDLVKEMEYFTHGRKSSTLDLYLKTLDISQEGRMEGQTSNGPIFEGAFTWTQGLFLDKLVKTASKYEIREIDGDTYMFFEWKDGDYSYLGRKPWYYVMKKVP